MNAEYHREYRQRNPEKVKRDLERAREWRKNNPELARARDKKYRSKPGANEYRMAYEAKHKDRLRVIRNDHIKRRRAEDPAYRLRRSMAARIQTAARRMCVIKSDATCALIGCSMDELKRHIESRFKVGMTWDNYGRKSGVRCWEIDHIIPCAKFDLSKPDQQRACFHFTNLQPLWRNENLHKKDRTLIRYLNLTEEELPCPVTASRH